MTTASLIRACVTAAALALSAVSLGAVTPDDYLRRGHAAARGFDPDSVAATLGALPLAPVEGLWQMTKEGGTFAIVADDRDHVYRLFTVDAADRNIMPGTLMGAATPTAKEGVFDATIYTSSRHSTLTKPKHFILTLTGDNRLIITSAEAKYNVSLWRLFPYMWRVRVTKTGGRPEGLDGAIRLYPEPIPPVGGPVYL